MPGSSVQARYAHTNLIARDWQALAQFYIEVFGCVPVPPERFYSSEVFDRLTGLQHATLRGMHLRLPGYGEGGPTLEIFQYDPPLGKPDPAVNRQGFGHVAFQVDDLASAHRAVLDAGGSAVGEIATLHPSPTSRVTVCYVTDPEGNILELQKWHPAEAS